MGVLLGWIVGAVMGAAFTLYLFLSGVIVVEDE